jgi:hypothetical protein
LLSKADSLLNTSLGSLSFFASKHTLQASKAVQDKEVRGGSHAESFYLRNYVELSEPALKEFGWMLYTEVLRNIEKIYKLWTMPSRSVPSEHFGNTSEKAHQTRSHTFQLERGCLPKDLQIKSKTNGTVWHRFDPERKTR